MLKEKNAAQWTNSSSQYGRIAVLFHWIAALCVVGLFGMGLWMHQLDYYHPFYTLAPFIHKSIGMLFFFLMTVRLLWRWFNIVPNAEDNQQHWQEVLAKWVHRLFYVLIFLILISGYLLATSDGKPVEVFNWFTLPAILSFSDQNDIAGDMHEVIAYLVMGLTAVHILGVIKHRFFK